MGNDENAQLSKLQALSHLSIALSESLSLNDVLYNAVVQCVEVLKFDGSVIFFVDENRQRLIAKHFHGVSREAQEAFSDIPLDGIGEEVYRTKQSVVKYDLTDYYNFRPALKKEGIKSIISAPIKIKNEVIGALSAVTKENRMLTKIDKQLIESVGLQIGVAYANVQMFESLQNLSNQLRESVAFIQEISTVLDKDKIINLIISELKNVFDSEVFIASLNRQNKLKVQPEITRMNFKFEELREVVLYFLDVLSNQPFLTNMINNKEIKRKLKLLNLESAIFLKFEIESSSHILIIKKEKGYFWEKAELSIAKAIGKSIENSFITTHYFQKLKKMQQHNSILLANQVATQEKERQRIAQEIHDSINQSLVGMYYYLQFGLEQVNKNPKKTESTLNSLLSMTKDNINELRTIINGLHPPTLEKYGFVGAVEVLINSINKRGDEFKVILIVEGEMKRLGEQEEIYLYRVIQEGINNIIKHSKSKKAKLYIFFYSGTIKIILIDDGIGFDVEKAFDNENSFGIKGMKKRIEDLGGTLKILSTEGFGTKIEVSLHDV